MDFSGWRKLTTTPGNTMAPGAINALTPRISPPCSEDCENLNVFQSMKKILTWKILRLTSQAVSWYDQKKRYKINTWKSFACLWYDMVYTTMYTMQPSVSYHLSLFFKSYVWPIARSLPWNFHWTAFILDFHLEFDCHVFINKHFICSFY